MFLIANDGALYYVSVTGTNTTWTVPVNLSSSFGPPGGGLATAMQGTNQLDIFAVGNDGALEVAWSIGLGGLTGPVNISSTGLAPPGAPVAAGVPGTNVLDAFVVGVDGAVKMASVVGQGAWSSPVDLSAADYGQVGGYLSTAIYGGSQLDLFYVNVGGTPTFEIVGTGSHQGPGPVISPADSAPGIATGTATQGTGNQLDFFVIDSQGVVMVSATSASTWSGVTRLPTP